MSVEIKSANFTGQTCNVTLYAATGNTIPYNNATQISLGSKEMPFTYTSSVVSNEYGVFSCFFQGFNKTCIVSQVTPPDGDGNVYKTIKIGNQVWMSENLRTKKSRDGTPLNNPGNVNIPDTPDGYTIWGGANGPSTRYWAEYGNINTYGLLYNQFAVTGTTDSTAICPTGWRVPTSSDFSTLESTLGASTAGIQMKSTTLWTTHATNFGTNTSGFNAVPAGLRYDTGIFGLISSHNFLYVTDVIGKGYQLVNSNANLGIYAPTPPDSRWGYSVRCIKI